MQNVGALRRLGECSTRCHLKMWSLGMLWYWDMWNAGKGRRHWNYFDKCNSIVCNQTLLLLLGCWMHVPAWLQLKRAGVFISRWLNVDGIPISLWAVAWWTRMQSVGAWKMLGVCSTRVPMHGKSKLPNLKGVHAEQQTLSGLVCGPPKVGCIRASPMVLNMWLQTVKLIVKKLKCAACCGW
jgi:hypothetical protein